MKKTSSIYVAGHTGLIGSAITRLFTKEGFENIIARRHEELDLTDQAAVERFFSLHSPQYVVLAAGRVGGILENKNHPADMIADNLSIQLNVLRSAFRARAKKVIFFGSSCMYPKEFSYPLPENALLTGAPEPTSLAYAISKIAGVQMCLAFNQELGEQHFIPIIPNSVYGPNDNFDINSGHVMSALIRRIHEAHSVGEETVTLWGTGRPRREFIHSDDVARACLMLLQRNTASLALPLNLGVGTDYSIQELAEIIAQIVGYRGRIEWDNTKPDGALRKLLEISRMRDFGWKAEIKLKDGIRMTYGSFLEKQSI